MFLTLIFVVVVTMITIAPKPLLINKNFSTNVIQLCHSGQCQKIRIIKVLAWISLQYLFGSLEVCFVSPIWGLIHCC